LYRVERLTPPFFPFPFKKFFFVPRTVPDLHAHHSFLNPVSRFEPSLTSNLQPGVTPYLLSPPAGAFFFPFPRLESPEVRGLFVTISHFRFRSVCFLIFSTTPPARPCFGFCIFAQNSSHSRTARYVPDCFDRTALPCPDRRCASLPIRSRNPRAIIQLTLRFAVFGPFTPQFLLHFPSFSQSGPLTRTMRLGFERSALPTAIVPRTPPLSRSFSLPRLSPTPMGWLIVGCQTWF